MSIEVRNISKTFGSFVALNDVSLAVAPGELVALLGPSGSGKTTLLRVIAGLEQPDAGSGPILFHDEDVARRGAGDRGVGFVFQHYALFRHMTVFENVAFGLRVRPLRLRPTAFAIRRRVMRLLKLVQLEYMADRYPHQLSGGQRQRVALARALAMDPQILLLDEPFGALDAKVRQELRQWLRRLHDEIHVTSVFVTHDQDEALELADRVVVMNAGRIEQTGTPDEVFHEPRTAFVMDFLGQVNRFHGRFDGDEVLFADIRWRLLDGARAGSGAAQVFVRPHELDLVSGDDERPASGGDAAPGIFSADGRLAHGFRAMVTHIHAAGPIVRVQLRTAAGDRLVAEVSQERRRTLNLTVGSDVLVAPREVKVFSA